MTAPISAALARLGTGQPTHEDLMVLADLATAGRLVATKPRRDRDARDQVIRSIRRAHLHDLLTDEAARVLATEWERYVGDRWPSESHRPPNPTCSDSFVAALHAATSLNGGETLRIRQIKNIFDGYRW